MIKYRSKHTKKGTKRKKRINDLKYKIKLLSDEINLLKSLRDKSNNLIKQYLNSK